MTPLAAWGTSPQSPAALRADMPRPFYVFRKESKTAQALLLQHEIPNDLTATEAVTVAALMHRTPATPSNSSCGPSTADELPLSIEAEERGQVVSHIALSSVKTTDGSVMFPRWQLAPDHRQQSTHCCRALVGLERRQCST